MLAYPSSIDLSSRTLRVLSALAPSLAEAMRTIRAKAFVVVQAYGAGVLSLETAVAMLMDAGYPIKDAAEEVARIRQSAQRESRVRVEEAAAARGGGRDGQPQEAAAGSGAEAAGQETGLNPGKRARTASQASPPMSLA
ncbi:hypothetical protein ACH4VT_30755 [Streptomyces lydicus]|uniref:hypothetical protein n=1 Tax=Streptomyces lydicus TaxID=47763 RepID=UPI0037A19A10